MQNGRKWQLTTVLHYMKNKVCTYGIETDQLLIRLNFYTEILLF